MTDIWDILIGVGIIIVGLAFFCAVSCLVFYYALGKDWNENDPYWRFMYGKILFPKKEVKILPKPMKLVFKQCAICKKSIQFQHEGTWCDKCKAPLHWSCISKANDLCPVCKMKRVSPEQIS
jgi:hypothetical protein